MKTLLIIVILPLLFSGCGVKEGAEFYSLQKQDNRLADSVSNLQVQVDALITENSRLSSELATNSLATHFLIEDQQTSKANLEKLQAQLDKLQKQLKQQ